MALETGTYISDLVATNPASTDPKSAGDDHLRLLKETIKSTLPGLTGAVTATHTELNYVVGVTSAIQPQIDTKAPSASPTFTGTVTLPATGSGANEAVTKGYADALPFGGVSPLPTTAAGGTVDAITATFSPAIALVDQQKCSVVCTGANTSITPTFAPNGLTAHTITMNGGQPLTVGSIGAAGYVALLEYNLANTRWELMNPVSIATTTAQLHAVAVSFQ